MNIELKNSRDEHGSVLVVTLFTAAIMGTILCSYLVLTSAENQSVNRSQNWNSALALAEAGVEEAMAQMNSGTNFSGNGWGYSGAFRGPVSRSLAGGSYTVCYGVGAQPTIYSTGYVTVPITGSRISRAVKVTTASLALMNVPLGAINNIDMHGNGAATDSWNSYDTNLSNNGYYTASKISSNGSVASVMGVVNLGNHTILGDLFLGPTASYSSGTGQVTGTIYYDYNVQFPDVTLPIPAGSFVAPPTTGSGKNAVHDFTVSGNYWINDSADIQVEPGVEVTLHVITTSFSPGNITMLGGLTNCGKMKVYQDSGSVSMAGNNSGAGNRPGDFYYFGLPGVTSITLSGNSTFIGVIYAPEASLTLNGGGNANNLEGSAIVNTVTLNGHYDFHYDMSLMTNGMTRGYVVSSWQEM